MGAETAPAVGARIAFFGPLTLIAEEIRRALEGRAFPVADVKLYDAAAEGTLSEFSGEALLVTRPDEDVIPALDIAFMCGTAEQTVPYLDWPARHGFVAVDLSGVGGGRPDVPIVHAGINPEAIAEGGVARPIVAVPRSLSHNLATVAAAAAPLARADRIDAVCLRPASDCGKGAIDELYRQTVAVLNFASVPQEEFGRQIAFNVLPAAALAGNHPAIRDGECALETSRLLGMSPDRVTVASAMLPWFHGHMTHIALSFRQSVDPDALREALAAARGIRAVTDPGEFSPVGLAGEEDLAVLLPDGATSPGPRHAFWCFCDNLRGGAALNAVRVAERIVDLRRGRSA